MIRSSESGSSVHMRTRVSSVKQGSNPSSGGGGGASSEKTSSQGIPNIPSSDFANTSIAMAESVFNLGGVDT